MLIVRFTQILSVSFANKAKSLGPCKRFIDHVTFLYDYAWSYNFDDKFSIIGFYHVIMGDTQLTALSAYQCQSYPSGKIRFIRMIYDQYQDARYKKMWTTSIINPHQESQSIISNAFAEHIKPTDKELHTVGLKYKFWHIK